MKGKVPEGALITKWPKSKFKTWVTKGNWPEEARSQTGQKRFSRHALWKEISHKKTTSQPGQNAIFKRGVMTGNWREEAQITTWLKRAFPERSYERIYARRSPDHKFKKSYNIIKQIQEQTLIIMQILERILKHMITFSSKYFDEFAANHKKHMQFLKQSLHKG